jgi:hypothetical protein
MDQGKLNLALRRLAKVAAAGLVAAVIGWLSGPDVADLVGEQGAVIIAAVLVPILSGLEKAYLPVTS